MSASTSDKTIDYTNLKRIAIIGSGGRENSLAWAIQKSKPVEKIFLIPGNAGSVEIKKCIRIENDLKDTRTLLDKLKENSIGFVIIGPEVPLANGLSDELRHSGFDVFGPSKEGAQIESSKIWAKELMKEGDIPTSKFWKIKSIQEAEKIINQEKKPLVVKADGLAAGKGVTVPETKEDTIIAIREAFEGKFGAAGETIILEEKISGPEVSIFAVCDGKNYLLLPPAQDHKRLLDGDEGPNTGGMGAYAPAKLLNKNDIERIKSLIIEPTINTLNNRKIDYRGIIYAGLMMTEKGPRVIEFNCRFGDPECQALMPLMGDNFAELLFYCAKGDLKNAPAMEISNNCSACIVIASKGYPNKYEKGVTVKINNKLVNNSYIFHSGTSLNKDGSLITSGGRVLTIASTGKDFTQVFKNAYKMINNVYFEGMTFRKDIGYQIRAIKTSDKKDVTN
tara:strand:+ start:15336 stop:16685 length:1350 start_codon:yes stop_codon:yes gene_type:complete